MGCGQRRKIFGTSTCFLIHSRAVHPTRRHPVCWAEDEWCGWLAATWLTAGRGHHRIVRRRNSHPEHQFLRVSTNSTTKMEYMAKTVFRFSGGLNKGNLAIYSDTEKTNLEVDASISDWKLQQVHLKLNFCEDSACLASSQNILPHLFPPPGKTYLQHSTIQLSC